MTAMTGKVRWGILGTGVVARDFAEGLASLPDAVIAAVASRTEAKAAAFAKAVGARAAFADYAALAASDAVDIVYIATPHIRHYDDILLCLDHGKPVLCEKPFVMTGAQAREVVRRAREKQLFCMEAMWMRYMPLVQEARTLIEQGRIGEPLVLTADFGVPAPPDPEGRFFSAALGGGALLDRGVYLVSLAQFLFGPVVGVKAEARICQTGVDQQSAIILKHEGGRLSVLHASLSVKSPTEASVLGTTGRLTLAEPFFAPERMVIASHPPPTSSAGAAGAGRIGKLVRRLPAARRLVRGLRRLRAETVIHRPHRLSPYRFEAAEAMRCLRANLAESPSMTLNQTIAVLDTLDQIRAQWGQTEP